VVLVGTGAVENSWRPLREALLRHDPVLPDGEENLAFAWAILELRHATAVRLAGWRLVLREGLQAPRLWWTLRTVLREQLARYNRLKRDIATELRTATEQGEIRLRRSAAEVVRSWINGQEPYAIITTNWDLALEVEFDAANVYHIHGHILDPPALYLPAEQSWEVYRYLDEGRFAAPRHSGLITHGNWLMTRVSRLAIVGLSLSPLDAELRSLLVSAVDAGRRPIDEVTIFDIDPEPVARRLMYYTRDSVAKLTLIRSTSAKR
jgi:hypothetical protein